MKSREEPFQMLNAGALVTSVIARIWTTCMQQCMHCVIQERYAIHVMAAVHIYLARCTLSVNTEKVNADFR